MTANLLRVAEELSSVIDSSQYQGGVSPKRAYPFHSEAPDGSYQILWNGDLSATYRLDSFSREVFHPLLLTAHAGHSIQLVTHRSPSGISNSFTTFTAPIEYRYNYSAFDSFLNAFRRGFRLQEYLRFRKATETAINRVQSYASLSTSSGYLTHISDINEVTGPLAHIDVRNAIPAFVEDVRYNLSYLKLPGGRCATAVGFLSHENVFQNGVKLPPSSIETMVLSLIRYPGSESLNSRLVEIQKHRNFASLFKPVRDESSLMTMSIDRSILLNVTRGFAEVQTFMFFLSSSPERLRKDVQEYLNTLSVAEISYSLSFLNTVDAFCSVFPGNVRVLREGSLVDFTDVTSVIEGFHQC